MSETITGPPGLPFLGNITDLDPLNASASLARIAETYGEIFKLNLGGVEKLYISSVELMNDVSDEKRFHKVVQAGLEQVRNGIHDGLFTAHTGEHNWEVAHRALMPAFGPLSINSMYDEMYDIASQLIMKWARFGPEEKIHVTDDFTRLTLDSIALCAMGTRFNSFYHEDMHPFVNAMVGFLTESGVRGQRPKLANYFMRAAQRKYDEDIELLQRTAKELVAERRAKPTEKKDLLNAMLYGKDPKTGEGLTDESICNNMITFLIAGHETTAGLLSFTFYNLLKHPAAYQKAQKEVDDVVGTNPITVAHMSKLPYVEACLKEALRLNPTAPAFTVGPRDDLPEGPILIGRGKYSVKPGQPIVALLGPIQQDPAVFGPDAREFKPERMMPEPFSKLPPNCFKAFGNGARGCIGRPFAWQEATLAVAMLLQCFDFRQHDPSYQLQIKSTLTIKPKDFFMHASLREHIDPVDLEKMLYAGTTNAQKTRSKVLGRPSTSSSKPKKPMTVLYGSNAGTCEALAQGLARAASGRGYDAKVAPLDEAVDKVPKDQPVIMISASYEGQPPDNAAHFLEWLLKLGGNKLQGTKFAVFGCGNHDWVSTFHKVPKQLQTGFEERGASQICDIGLGDVAEGDIFGDFDKWQDEKLWAAIGGEGNVEEESGIDLEIDTDSRRSTLRQDMKEAVVLINESLTADGQVNEKRHLVLQLPSGMDYKVGDYLAVLPINHSKIVRRVLKWAKLPWDAMLTIKSGANTTLPTGRQISAYDVLAAYVELSQPATRKNVTKIASSCTDPSEAEKLTELAGKSYNKEIMLKRRSPLDLLEEYPSAALPLGDFLAMLPPMRIRQYSISSSPLSDPTIATITWSVLDTPSKAADHKRFLGVASNYLSNVEEGDRIHVGVKPSHGKFHPPGDIENTPLIMICAGTGLAPFRGFIQERALQKSAGRKTAPAFLFVGCAHPEKDQLFKPEFTQWEKEGVVTVFYAYSKCTEHSKGCKHVQDRVWEEREDMKKVFEQGAKLYVCGSSMVGEGVAHILKKIYEEAAEALGKDKTAEEIEAWWQEIKSDRYASDVFA
ncbi:fatty acid hydroxylase [Amylocarpus encephaloides]|uniref:Bifunctional cytochrome P450/NADPH--P450 reductase n=1 Tax=Amylocarpus encephaloides TaxID=45428 RepID=A0A9P7YGQ2_9HELO|nr:fatty acid hydroxylase [Amylocarpus encephaloides]